jgi:6-phosphogluconate dehydrogenase
MKIAIIGLGKMGKQVARKLHEAKYSVVVYNRSKNSIDEMATLGMTPAYTRQDVVNFFDKEQVIVWMMVNAENMDAELTEWLKILPKESIVVDGGNSDFRLTKKRAILVSEKGSIFMDVGTSGGVWGYQNGFCMMAGGDKKTFGVIEGILKTLALPSGTYQYFGESGAGHFVKMTHNAIEYGMMESLAEGYRLLKEGPYKNLDLAAAGEVWQHHSVITSWLNELTANALKTQNGNFELKEVDGKVVESGEARWALEIAKELNIETPSIRAAFDVRIESQKGKINFATKLLALMRNAFGGHKINEEKK